MTITSKGQVTFRKELLEHLGSSPGDRLIVEKLPDGRLQVQAAQAAVPIEKLFGLLRQDGQRVLSIAEMAEIATEGWAGKR